MIRTVTGVVSKLKRDSSGSVSHLSINSKNEILMGERGEEELPEDYQRELEEMKVDYSRMQEVHQELFL